MATKKRSKGSKSAGKKPSRSSPAKKPTPKKKPAPTKPAASKPAARKPPASKPAASKAAASKPAASKPTPSKPTASLPAASKPAPARPVRRVRLGFISHTELASSAPVATMDWCRKVLGWKFIDPMPTPSGPYYMWDFGDNMGGGIRASNPPEVPGTVPYCEVPDVKAAFQRAIVAGATGMMPPSEIPGGNGTIAIVGAPGGVTFGFWQP